jgi:hypothetical protein
MGGEDGQAGPSAGDHQRPTGNSAAQATGGKLVVRARGADALMQAWLTGMGRHSKWVGLHEKGSPMRVHACAAQVLKVGTSSLYNQELSCVNINNLSRITEAVKQLHRMGAW